MKAGFTVRTHKLIAGKPSVIIVENYPMANKVEIWQSPDKRIFSKHYTVGFWQQKGTKQKELNKR